MGEECVVSHSSISMVKTSMNSQACENNFPKRAGEPRGSCSVIQALAEVEQQRVGVVGGRNGDWQLPLRIDVSGNDFRQ